MTNPPFKLDMPFDEALRRFAKTDPKEMKVNDASSAPKDEWIVIAKGTFDPPAVMTIMGSPAAMNIGGLEGEAELNGLLPRKAKPKASTMRIRK